MQAGFEGDLQRRRRRRQRQGQCARRGRRSRAMADDRRRELSRHGHGHAGVADRRASTSPTGCWCVSDIAGRDRRRSGLRQRQCRDQGRLAASDRRPGASMPSTSQPVAAMVVGDAGIAGRAGSWPTVPFQAKVATPFTADLDLTFGSVSAGIFGVLEDAQMHAALARDGVRLSGLSGKLDGGELTGLLEARNNDGTALVSTQFKLAGADLGQVLDGSGLTGIGRHRGVAFGQRQVGRGAGRLAVRFGNRGRARMRAFRASTRMRSRRCLPAPTGSAARSMRHAPRRSRRRSCRPEPSSRRRRRSPSPLPPACCAPRRSRSTPARRRCRPISRPSSAPAWSAAAGTVTYAAGRRGAWPDRIRPCASRSKGRLARCRANTTPSRWRSS